MTNVELKCLRIRLGLTQKELADYLGMPNTTTLSRYEMRSNNTGRYAIPNWLAVAVTRLADEHEMRKKLKKASEEDEA